MPNSVSYLDRTPIFERYVIKYVSKNGYQNICIEKRLDYAIKNDKHSKLSSNIIGGTYMTI